MMTFLAVLLAPLMGISLATLIFGVLLSSNNIGDSVGSNSYYAGTPQFDERINRGSRQECEQLVYRCRMDFAGNTDSEDIEKKIRVALTYQQSANSSFNGKAKVSSLENDPFDFDGELPPSDTPVFKPLDPED